MAVAFDAVGPGATATNSSTSPLTWSHTDAAAVTAILNFATSFTGSSNLVTANTYAGTALGLLGFQVSGGGGHTAGGIALYYLASPAAGANNNSVTFTGAQDCIAASVSVTGSAGRGTPVTNFATASTTVSATLTSTTTGGLIVAAACYGGGAGVFSGTNSVTVRSSLVFSSGSAADNAVIGTVASTGGGASQTVGFSTTGAADNWGLVVVELLPAAARLLIVNQAVKRAALY